MTGFGLTELVILVVLLGIGYFVFLAIRGVKSKHLPFMQDFINQSSTQQTRVIAYACAKGYESADWDTFTEQEQLERARAAEQALMKSAAENTPAAWQRFDRILEIGKAYMEDAMGGNA